jgi:uncharacterized protein
MINSLFLLAQCVLFCFLIASAESDAEWYARKLHTNETGQFQSSRLHVLRLSPNEDLLASLYRYARVLNIGAASVVSTVGSLTTTNIRYANQDDGTVLTGHFEIVSLVGNIDLQKNYDSGHIHISVSNENGETIGGHLLDGNIVYTTAEITLLEILHAQFDRQLDDKPGGSNYYELKVLRN